MSGTDRALLEKNYPGLLRDLEIHNEDELDSKDFTVETASFGLPVLKIRGRYAHSSRDPEREGKRQVEILAAPETKDSPVFILGFGLGYSAQAAAEIAGERPIIIVEKRRELLRLALETRDFGPFLLHNRIAFVLGKNSGIRGVLSLFEKNRGKPVIIRNRAITGLDEEWYQGVEAKIRTWASRDSVNRATLTRFGRRWVQNLAQNLWAIRELPGISRLNCLLKDTDIPVFLTAAGPTLDETGPFLPEIAKRCLVISVDTSLRFAQAAGIEPDFVVSLDPQYWNYRHLDRTRAWNTCLIAESAVYPSCLRHPFKDVFLSGSLFPLGRFIENRVDPKGEVGAGGSVATAAWDFARVLGASSIWIAGLDLSFPQLKTHFKGAVFEEKSHAQSFRFFPGETWSTRALRDGSPFYAKNAGGSPVLTDQRLSLYAAWFENRFAMFPEIKKFSLSLEGLAIKGLESRSLEMLLALPERRDEINSLLEKRFSTVKNEFFEARAVKNRETAYQNALETLLTGLGDIKNTAEDAAKSAETWISRFKMGYTQAGDEKKVLEKLEKANLAITGSPVREVAGFLFPDVGESGAETADPLLRHLEYSCRVYQSLAAAASENLTFLEKRQPFSLPGEKR